MDPGSVLGTTAIDGDPIYSSDLCRHLFFLSSFLSLIILKYDTIVLICAKSLGREPLCHLVGQGFFSLVFLSEIMDFWFNRRVFQRSPDRFWIWESHHKNPSLLFQNSKQFLFLHKTPLTPTEIWECPSMIFFIYHSPLLFPTVGIWGKIKRLFIVLWSLKHVTIPRK